VSRLEKVAEKFSDVLLDGGKILFAGAVVVNIFEKSESENYIIAGGIIALTLIILGLVLTYLTTSKKEV